MGAARPPRPADEHRRNAEAREGLWKRVVAVERHENDAVDVPLPYVTLDLRVLPIVARHEEEELELRLCESGRNAPNDAREERV